ncbi:MAG UNVERIFIED_CONTAM: hypothetical protein LVR18_44960 [Planctomycetaceae bacterium]
MRPPPSAVPQVVAWLHVPGERPQQVEQAWRPVAGQEAQVWTAIQLALSWFAWWAGG